MKVFGTILISSLFESNYRLYPIIIFNLSNRNLQSWIHSSGSFWTFSPRSSLDLAQDLYRASSILGTSLERTACTPSLLLLLPLPLLLSEKDSPGRRAFPGSVSNLAFSALKSSEAYYRADSNSLSYDTAQWNRPGSWACYFADVASSDSQESRGIRSSRFGFRPGRAASDWGNKFLREAKNSNVSQARN